MGKQGGCCVTQSPCRCLQAVSTWSLLDGGSKKLEKWSCHRECASGRVFLTASPAVAWFQSNPCSIKIKSPLQYFPFPLFPKASCLWQDTAQHPGRTGRLVPRLSPSRRGESLLLGCPRPSLPSDLAARRRGGHAAAVGLISSGNRAKNT